MAAASDEGLLFENSGILSFVLDTLKLCEVKTFDKVMAALSLRGGGDSTSPSTWIKVLLKAHQFEPRCRLQIAQNIGPLVSCMCGDTKRVFFKSNKHWRQSILPFVELISILICFEIEDNLGDLDKKKVVVEALLQHEGLLQSIVQWGFWVEEYRPDITKELDIEDCTEIVGLGRDIAALLSATSAQSRIETLGTTPIVSKQCDPSCLVSYVAGLVRFMKTFGQAKIDQFFPVLLRFIDSDADCVDK